MARRISLYIEDAEIKLLVTSGTRVEQWASMLLQSGLVAEGVIQNEDRVAEAITQFFALQKVSETSVVVGVSGLNAISRIISLPQIGKNLLQEAVANEASRVLPLPLSQVYYSYQAISAGKNETRVFLSAYPRDSTDALLNTLKKAGLKPQAMDIAPLALARCVNAKQAIIVNTWLSYVDIVILSERVPIVIRSFSLPPEGSSPEEKHEAISEEISRTVTFYNSTYPEKSLEKSVVLYLSGDISTHKDAAQQLSKLGFQVKNIEPPVTGPELFDASRYMVNVGLGVKGKLPGGDSNQYSIIDFNALPLAYRPTAFSWARVLMPVGAVVAISVLAWGAYQLVSLRGEIKLLSDQNNQMMSLANAQRTANTKLQNDITVQTGGAGALSSQAEKIQAQIGTAAANETFFNETLGNLKAGLGDSARNFREIVNDVPKNLNLLGIEYDNSSATINGNAPSQDLILTYARALRSSGRFNSVLVSSIGAGDNGGLVFVISLS